LLPVEFEDEAKPVVEGDEFLIGHPSDEFAESFWRNGRRLLDQDLSRLIIDVMVGRNLRGAADRDVGKSLAPGWFDKEK
jgi:hypothetical protein